MLMLSTFDELFHAEVLSGCPSVYSTDFLDMLMSQCLFSREKVGKDDGELSYPLCKNDHSRYCALRLVSQLFKDNGLLQISKHLEPIIKDGSWRSNKREKWFIQSAKLFHRTTHVGLVNLGCT
mmetsp:Transcript_42103/g.48844  ORF Transcript_42103/g.48844 Transcript_42103/m.48844 type:complete len:123 (-) Transcript_42103:3141-3509(-)